MGKLSRKLKRRQDQYTDFLRMARGIFPDRPQLEEGSTFDFSCIQCGECCSDGNPITITPYEFMLINDYVEANSLTKGGLALSGLAIIKNNGNKIKPRYRTAGIPLIKLSRPCIYLKNNRCSIYEVRPVNCRLFPLAREWNEDEVIYYLNECDKARKRKQTVKKWIRKNDLEKYDDSRRLWLRVVNKLAKEKVLVPINPDDENYVYYLGCLYFPEKRWDIKGTAEQRFRETMEMILENPRILLKDE